MKHLEDLTVKELRQPKKIESNQEANRETNQKIKKAPKTEGQLVRIWHDVVRGLPAGTPVTVKMISDENRIKTFTGDIRVGTRKREDGLPDVFIKTHTKKPFNIQLYDNIQVFMTEKDFQKAKYSK